MFEVHPWHPGTSLDPKCICSFLDLLVLLMFLHTEPSLPPFYPATHQCKPSAQTGAKSLWFREIPPFYSLLSPLIHAGGRHPMAQPLPSS